MERISEFEINLSNGVGHSSSIILTFTQLQLQKTSVSGNFHGVFTFFCKLMWHSELPLVMVRKIRQLEQDLKQ
jgi:hypothetical protein